MPATVRLFVSSTFVDLHAERDALARHCFPEARRRFAQAGVGFIEIDLRWGLLAGTPEMQIVQLCLQEVQQCKDYFIAILGHRYGFVPNTPPPVPGSFADTWPESASVTEFEIRAGAFGKPPVKFARFYFDADDTKDDEPELARLKAEIVARGLPVRHYQSPQALAAMVLEDLSALAVEEQRASPAPPDLLAAQLKILGQGCVARPAAQRELEQWLAGDGRRLLVHGIGGCGKTALLASWISSHRLQPQPQRPATGWRAWLPMLQRQFGNRGDLWVAHFAGAEAGEGRFARMLGATAAQMLRAGDEPWNDGGTLAERLLKWHRLIARACTQHQTVVLLLDGVDNLNLDRALPLHWLPETRPNLKVVISGRGPGLAEKLNEMTPAWQTLSIDALEPPEMQAALGAYLKAFGKALPPESTTRLAANALFSHAATLRLLADELRLLRNPEQVDRHTAALAALGSALQLIEFMLHRLEAENGTELLTDVCGFLWLSRGGLEEGELRTLIQSRHQLPAWMWSGLMQTFRLSIFDRNGRIGLFDPALRDVVECRYLQDHALRRHLHGALVDAYRCQPGPRTQPTRRAVEELPWQLAAAADWPALSSLFRQADFMAACWRLEPDQCRIYWQALIAAQGAGELTLATDAWINDGAATAADLSDLALLLVELGALGAAVQMAAGIGSRLRATVAAQSPEGAAWGGRQDNARLANLLSLASLMVEAGELRQAELTLADVGLLVDEHTPLALRAVSRNAQGSLLMAQGRFEEAAAHFADSEALHLARGDAGAAASSQHNRALALARSGQEKQARLLLEQCAKIFEQLKDTRALIKTDISRARLQQSAGALKDAIRTAARPEKLARENNDLVQLAQVLAVRACLVEVMGQRDDADAVQREREEIFIRLGQVDGRLDALLCRVAIRMNLGRRGLPAADRLLNQAQALAQERTGCGDGPQPGTLARMRQLRASIDQRTNAATAGAELAERRIGSPQS